MRLFIATRIDGGLASEVERAMRRVRSTAARASWVSAHAFHLTYAFLGEHDGETAERLVRRLPGAMCAIPAYKGELSGGGFFPKVSRPRVGWLSFSNPEPLLSIAGSVRQLLDTERVDYDRKAFKPHLTIVRIRGRWGRRDVDEFLQASRALVGHEIVIDRVSLFRSELSPSGAQHHELVEAPLAAG